ncbi:MAG: DUF4112 domain-containing protein [Bryobacteraceae bacterium]
MPSTAKQTEIDKSIEKIAWLMDRSIPLGGNYSIGLDPIIGLIPGLGDLFGTLVSSYLVLLAHRAGIPKPTLLRMVANVGIDSIMGTIPFAGDLFDFAFKANARNLELYREAATGNRDTRKDAGFLAILFLLLVVLLAIPITAIVWLAKTFF